ncbi:MAG: hypothetical protein ACFE95_08295 [Candidatus Hodarchaeota archaeon]
MKEKLIPKFREIATIVFDWDWVVDPVPDVYQVLEKAQKVEIIRAGIKLQLKAIESKIGFYTEVADLYKGVIIVSGYISHQLKILESKKAFFEDLSKKVEGGIIVEG